MTQRFPSGNIPKGTQNTNSEEHEHPYVHCRFIYNQQDVEQLKGPSVDEWMKQLWNIYIMEYYLTKRKEKVLPFATAWMDLDNIMLSGISQAEKDKYHMISLICGI